MVVKHISIDVESVSGIELKAKKGENESRKIVVTFVAGNEQIVLNKDMTVTIRGVKPDGTVIYPPKNSNTDSPVYDNGGVLEGKGGIKATADDEVVLDPSITKQLLTPVSNQQFDTFVKDIGLLFGMSKSTANHGAVFTGGLLGRDSHDSHYSVNGVPIPVDAAQKYTIAELFENMNLIPNI